MTNSEAKYWLDALKYTIDITYRRYGKFLGMTLGDLRGEAWIVIDKTLREVDPEKGVLSFLSKNFRNHMMDLVRSKVAYNKALNNYTEGVTYFGNTSYELDRFYDVLFMAKRLTPTELKIVESIAMGETSKQTMKKYKLTRHQFYHARALAQGKLGEIKTT